MHIFIHPISLCLFVGAFNSFTFTVIINMYDPTTILKNQFSLVSVGLFSSLMFPAKRSFFSICCKAGLVVLKSLNFHLSLNLLISPSNLNKGLAGQSVLGCSFFLFIILNISCHAFLAYRVAVEKSADNIMGVPLYIICHFPLLLLIFYVHL